MTQKPTYETSTEEAMFIQYLQSMAKIIRASDDFPGTADEANLVSGILNGMAAAVSIQGVQDSLLHTLDNLQRRAG